MITATEAKQRLQDGNKRFMEGHKTLDASAAQRAAAMRGQAPFAVILGCSDSRVPAELVFDQGLGELFVIRIAGNIVAPSQVGSVEFAVENYGTPLVVVLGHSMCGAVKATVDELQSPSIHHSKNMMSILSRIRPAVEPLFFTDLPEQPDKLMQAAIRANIAASTNQLRHGSSKLEYLLQQGKLEIIGAEYCLESGEVNFMDERPWFAGKRT